MKKQRRKRKHLKKWVKCLIVLILVIPCFFFAKDVYAEYYPFSAINNIDDPSIEVHYNAIDHVFFTGDNDKLTNTTLEIKDINNVVHIMQTDENGNIVTGVWNGETNYYLFDENGYLVKESGEYNGSYYEIHDDATLYHNEWKDKLWYVVGKPAGQDKTQLLFISGETGFYCLDVNHGGQKCINSSITLLDGREVRFDENGNIVTNEVYDGKQYYFPVAEASETATETKLIPLDAYQKNFETKDVKLVNHRGYHVEYPENTLAAYQESKEKGYQYVETDIQLTKDGVPVLIHNQSLKNMSGVDVSIDSLTLEQAKTYPFKGGETITTLEEFIAYCKANLLTPYIELKVETIHSEDQIKSIYDIVDKYAMIGKVQWISFSSDLVEMMAKYDSQDRLGYVVGRLANPDEAKATTLRLKEAGLNLFLDLHYQMQSTYLDFCKINSIPVEVWTVDDTDAYNSVDSYVTGITTDIITY